MNKRVGKTAFLLMGMLVIGNSMATTRSVPSSYANMQAAINAAAPGDLIYITASYNENSTVTMNKQLNVEGNGYIIRFYNAVPGINVTASGCDFHRVTLMTYSSSAVVRVGTVSGTTIHFSYVTFYGVGSSGYLLDDWGTQRTNMDNCTFNAAANIGIDAENADYTLGGTNTFYSATRGINFYAYSGNHELDVDGANFPMHYSSNANAACVWLQSTYFRCTGSDFSLTGGTDSYPIKMNGGATLYIIANTFDQCPNTGAWNKTSTDQVINPYPGSMTYNYNCAPGN